MRRVMGWQEPGLSWASCSMSWLREPRTAPVSMPAGWRRGSVVLPPEAAAALIGSSDSSSSIGPLVFRIYRLLFDAHRRGAAAKGAIEFLHISKSGGTSMCSVADRNGCSAESVTNFGNCMVRRFDDRPRWVSAEVHNETGPLHGWRWYYRYLVRRGERSCEYRDEFLQRMGYTFYSNEFAVHGGLDPPSWPPPGTAPAPLGINAPTPRSSIIPDPPLSSAHLCPQFLNLVMLRHPMHRLMSHVLWIMKVYRTEYGRSYEPYFRGRDADYWRRFAPAAVDNYYVRLLLGESAFYAPAETINATHLAAARLMLLQYDVVLLLEAPDIDDLWTPQALGWRVGLTGARARVAGQPKALMDLLPYDLDELMAGSGEDVQLYEFGAVIHQLDGLMFAAVAAAGIQPYERYDQIDPAGDEQALRQRVRCGYVTRKKDFLTRRGYNISALQRKYPRMFPRMFAADEKVPGPAAAGDAAPGSAHDPGLPRGGRHRHKRHKATKIQLQKQHTQGPPMQNSVPQSGQQVDAAEQQQLKLKEQLRLEQEQQRQQEQQQQQGSVLQVGPQGITAV